jgi:SAM-dependent methyltransferase
MADSRTAMVGRGVRAIGRQARSLLRDPAKLRQLMTRRYWRTLRYHFTGPRPTWETHDGLNIRRYESYQHYVDHQRSKLELLDLSNYDAEYRQRLGERLATLPLELTGCSVVCLAARLGTEVKAFHDVGAFAVGTDLNPGESNPLVLVGDFHDIQFPADCVDVVFCNSIDHSLEPSRLAKEVYRVLKPGGHAILELGHAELAQGDTRDSAELGRGMGAGGDRAWEAFRWSSHDEVLDILREPGFDEVHRMPIDYPSTHDLLVVLLKPRLS